MALHEQRVGRPPKTSRQQILDAAARLEPSDLQMTSLAKRLDVSLQTLYNYFPTRGALLDALKERAVANMTVPQVEGCQSWRDVLVEAAAWSYQVGVTHPEWFVSSGTEALAGGSQAMHAVLTRLVALGVPELSAFTAVATITNWAGATGIAAHRTRAMGGTSDANVRDLLADYSSPDTVDQLQRLMRQLDVEELYNTGLTIVLDGVASYLHDPPAEGRP